MASGIDVVIVSFRGRDHLRRCLASLRDEREAGRELDVVVIDNASGDPTPDMVATEFPEFALIRNDDNRGFGRASNQGIIRGSSDLVLILNPDARIGPETLGPLVDVLKREPTVAAVGPSLVRADGSLDHAAKRSFPTIQGALTYFTGLERIFPSLRQYTAPEVTEGPVDAINGAFMLIRRDALEEVGTFDEGYWMYMEDLDLCQRFWNANRPVWFEPRSTAWHEKGGSSGSVRSLRLNVAFHYGMYRFYRKFQAPDHGLILNLAVYAGVAAKLVVSLLRGLVARLGALVSRRPSRG